MSFKVTLVVALYFILYTLFPVPTFASDSQFSSTYDVTYKVSESGLTTVTQNVHLTNLTSDVFASEYVLRLSDTEVSNLHALDRKGPIKVQQEKKNGHDVVHFKFNEHITGVGKTLHWTLIYETSKIAHKAGNIWEISIPPPEISSNNISYTIGLYVPVSFGVPLYLKPQPNLGASLWNVTGGTKSGISAAYMEGPVSKKPFQSYDYNLKYHLQNTGFLNSVEQIALPPDTNYQKVFLTSLRPKPTNVTLDADGNWIASYMLGPSTKFEITAIGSIAVYSSPQKNSPDLKIDSQLISPRQFWESNNNLIQKKAQQLKTPEKIYDYVVNTLSYDPSRITQKKGRLGAVAVLKNPLSAICMEFTDLFIALARAANIPAREVDGYGYTSDLQRQPVSAGRDVLHAWPEYFDKTANSWKMVDPTWGNTTGGIDYFHQFDFDHITFVIRGQNSVLPLPAGSYKIFKTEFGRQSPSKDITISPSENLTLNESPTLKLLPESHLEVISPFPSTLSFKLTNSGPTLSSEFLLLPQSENLLTPASIKVAPIPPFGHVIHTFTLHPSSFFQDGNAIISFDLYGQKQEIVVKIVPFYKSWKVILGAIILFTFTAIVYQIIRHKFIN